MPSGPVEGSARPPRSGHHIAQSPFLAPRYGLDTIGYPTAMLVTIALWLIVAPLAAASGKKGKK